MLLADFYLKCDVTPISNERGCRFWRGKNKKFQIHINGQKKKEIGTRHVLAKKLGRPLKEKYFACHHCDNPGCIVPDHLYEGTNQQNQIDAVNRGQIKTGKNSWSSTHLDRVARGDRHVSRTKPEVLPKGESHGRSKLTNTSVKEIRKLYNTKEYSQTQLAEKYGVKQTAISRIVRGIRWRHV